MVEKPNDCPCGNCIGYLPKCKCEYCTKHREYMNTRNERVDGHRPDGYRSGVQTNPKRILTPMNKERPYAIYSDYDGALFSDLTHTEAMEKAAVLATERRKPVYILVVVSQVAPRLDVTVTPWTLPALGGEVKQPEEVK